MSEMQLHTSENLESRAFNAYFRACERLGGTPAQPSNASGVVELDDKQYVVLRNCNGILAVYRVRNDGKLKGLKLWPAGID